MKLPGASTRRTPGSIRRIRAAHLVTSELLTYPDAELYGKLPLLAEVAGDLPRATGEPLLRLVEHLRTVGADDAAEHYVDTFDLRRRCCLYLTYYTHGDTRRRGTALVRFVNAYRAAGVAVDGGELPDHLAVVLEFSAAGYTEQAIELLRDHRPGLELLWRALGQLNSPYAGALAAVRATLPAAAPSELETARLLAEEGPPAEQVGLAPPPTPELAAAARPGPVPLEAPRLLIRTNPAAVSPGTGDGGAR